MNLKDIDIEDILPQRPPMLMVDALTLFDDAASATEFEVRPECIFVSDGKLTAEGIVENVAQTCAARTGYHKKYILHQRVEIGFIGAVRKFRIYACPEVGETLHTEIVVRSEFFGISMVDARVSDSEGNMIAEGVMKIAVRQDGEGGDSAPSGVIDDCRAQKSGV